MWIITGCFDEEDKQSSKLKAKLLKPGITYSIGRKPREEPHHLVINKSAISRDQGKLVIGSHFIDDVNSPEIVPTIRFVNLARTKSHLIRNKETVQQNIGQNETADIEPNDALQLSSGNQKEPGVTLIFEWKSIFPLFSHLPKVQLASMANRAAPLGLKFAKRISPAITHFVIDTLDLSSEKLYVSLMACAEIVNHAWWEEVCTRASTPRGEEGSWEDEFVQLERTARWTPELEDGFTEAFLEVDERRRSLFDGLTVVLLSDASTQSEVISQLNLGGALVETIDLLEAETTAVSLLPQLLSMQKTAVAGLQISTSANNGTQSSGLRVVLAKDSVKEALRRTWVKYEKIVSSLGLSIMTLEDIHHCILRVSTEFLPNAHAPRLSQAPHPQLVAESESHIEFPSEGPRRESIGQSSLRDEVPAAVPEAKGAEDIQSTLATTQLKRRRGRTLVEDLLDDDDDDALPPVPVARGCTPDASQTTRNVAPPSTTRKRKRTVLETVFDDTIEEIPEIEPEYKRLRREEEERESSENYQKASERAAAVIEAVYRQHHGESVQLPAMTQEELAATKERRRTAASLLEDEDVVITTLGRKRKAGEIEQEDLHATGSGPPQKRPTRAGTQDVDLRHQPRTLPKPTAHDTPHNTLDPATRRLATDTHSSTSQRQKPLAGTEIPMDTDPQFLQALASRKRGKRKEDQFDRDFNALRISAPIKEQALASGPALDDYRIMDDLDFGGPAPVGNFMKVVLTKEVFRKDRSATNPERVPRNPSYGMDENGVWTGQKPWDDPKWGARPNYKAFVKNTKRPLERQVVALALPPVEDYGMGTAYWKGDEPSGRSASKAQNRPNVRRGTLGLSRDTDGDFGTSDVAYSMDKGRNSHELDSAHPISAAPGRSDMDNSGIALQRRSRSREHSVGLVASASRTSVKSKIPTIHEDTDVRPADRTVRNTRSRGSTAVATSRKSGQKQITDDEVSIADTDDALPDVRRRVRGSRKAESTLISSGGKRTPAVSQREGRKKTQALAAQDDSDEDIRVRRKRKL